jgi:hypothetical protein
MVHGSLPWRGCRYGQGAGRQPESGPRNADDHGRVANLQQRPMVPGVGGNPMTTTVFAMYFLMANQWWMDATSLGVPTFSSIETCQAYVEHLKHAKPPPDLPELCLPHSPKNPKGNEGPCNGINDGCMTKAVGDAMFDLLQSQAKK